MKTNINPTNMLRLLREGGPQTNKQLRTVLGFPDALNEMGEVLQGLKIQGEARPTKYGGPLWQAEGGVRLYVYLPDTASAELVRKFVKAQKGKVIS